MNISANKEHLTSFLTTFKPKSELKNRMLAIFSAAITFDDNKITETAIQKSLELHVERDELYEIILQSYLFLGFPRMLQAADILHNVASNSHTEYAKKNFLSENDLIEWYKDGESVCKQVYLEKYEPLKKRVLDIAPDIYHWMIVEGYGKVLSRQKLSIQTRELSIVSFLTMENRTRQLHSHILGALNVGVTKDLVKIVVDDIGLSAGDGYKTALSILENI